MKIIYSLLVVLIGFLLGCSGSGESNLQQVDTGEKETVEEIKAVIDRKNKEIVEYYAKGMIDSAARHFSSDVIQLPPNMPAIRGNENWKAAWKQNMMFGDWDFSLEAVEVRASGDLAVELGKYTLDFTPNQTSPIPAMSDAGNYVVLWQKIDGEWKIVWDAPVSEKPLILPDTTLVEG